MGEPKATINLPLYLEALSRVPGVTDKDVEEAKGVFAAAFSEVPKELTFYRGSGEGDGRIYAKRHWYDYDYASAVKFFEDGSVREEAGQFSLKLPGSMAKFFFAGIFGEDELTKPLTKIELCIVRGVRALYQCVSAVDSFEACESVF